MKRNIISELLENVSPKFISNTAKAFQENESSIGEGLKNIVPTIFYQLNYKMDNGNANEFFQFLKNEKHITFANQTDGVHLERKNVGNDFVQKLFGNQRQGILDFISNKNQLSSNSSKALMSVGSTLVIGYLSKLIRGEGLKLGSFKQLLSGQQGAIESALPVGINKWLGNIRPLSTTSANGSVGSQQVATKGATAAAYASTASAASDTAATAGGSSAGWAKWLLLLPILFLGLWYFLGGNSSTESTDVLADTNVPSVTKTTPAPVQPAETKDPLIQATEEFAEKQTIEDSKVADKSVGNNNTIAASKPSVKKDPPVIIYPPVAVEEVSIEAPSSPDGGVNSDVFTGKGQYSSNNNSTSSSNQSIDYNNMGSSSGMVATKAKKISYEDYTAKVKMPASAKTVVSSIEKQTTTSRPEWYIESKKVVNGNSGNVTSVKIKETILESRNTSQLAMLRKSLPLEKYNAWFGFITNPISSTEYRLYNYLNGTNEIAATTSGVDNYTWFNLDEVKFKSFSSKMDYDVSKGQLTRIANILSANPDVKLRIGGFTSDQGRKRTNRKLSLEMAKQTRAALVKLGVDESRIAVKGYGESFPLGLNDTEAGRMKNHRVGFRVLSK